MSAYADQNHAPSLTDVRLESGNRITHTSGASIEQEQKRDE
nr:hypothetical protein [uncultured Blautia sp.]